MADFLDKSGLSYCGKEARDIMSKDVYSLDIRNLGITFLPNLKGKEKIHTGEISDLFQEYSCPFTPEGNAVLGEWYIEPTAIKVNVEACYDEFWNTWLVEQTEISLRGGVPATFADWYFAKFREKMKQEYQEIWWKGDTEVSSANTHYQYLKVIDGIEKQLEENSGVTKISGAVFTVDNILAQVEAAINSGLGLAADGGWSTENYKVFMNKNDVRLLKMALGKVCCPNSESIFSNYAKGPDGGAIIFGFEVIPTEQSRNTIIFANPKNLVLGFDVFDSHTEYRFIDLRETLGSNQFRVIAISNIAAALVWPETMVYSRVA